MLTRFKVSPEVRSSTDDDGSTILHITQDKIYSIIGVGSWVWARLASSSNGLTHADIVDQLSVAFCEVPRLKIESDVKRLLTSFQQKMLILVSNRSGDSDSTLKRLSPICLFLLRFTTTCLFKLKLTVMAAFLGLLAVDVLLTLVSFGSVYNLVKQWPVNSRASHLGVEEIIEIVSRGMTWYPKQAMCLQRSAVISCLLRTCGYKAEMVIGCQRLPFLAHAWVELGGEVVNDRQSVRETHKVLDRC